MPDDPIQTLQLQVVFLRRYGRWLSRTLPLEWPQPLRIRLAWLPYYLYASQIMGSTPRKVHTEEQLYVSALRALMRRAHSVYEMRAYLERRAQDKNAVPPVMRRLKEQGYLDDARYAKQFARARAQNRRHGGYRISRDLRARGIPDRHIQGAVQDAFREGDEATLARQRIERKLRSVSGPLDGKKLASLYRNLLRAGFSADIIRRELRAASKLAAELPDPALPDES